MSSPQAIYNELHAALLRHEAAVLSTIIASSGSTPRGAGAKMLTTQNKQHSGTIGGGSVENAAQQLACALLNEKRSTTEGFCLRPNEAADLGMVCGGDVQVFFQYFAPSEANKTLMEAISRAFSSEKDAWFLTAIGAQNEWQSCVYELPLAAAGNNAHETYSLFASIIPKLNHAPLLVSGDPLYFCEPLASAGRVCVFGGGHVARALVPVLVNIGFRVLVFEDRPVFASPALFPDAERIFLCDFNDYLHERQFGENDYLIIMTRGHQADFQVLEQALKTPAYYIGMIGSHKKIASTRAQILAAGFSEADFARVHTPIGLAIGAQTPEEIAISIAAELIACRAKAQPPEGATNA